MKDISLVAWSYLIFGMGTCGYFCAAAIGNWPAPVLTVVPAGNALGPRTGYTGGGSHSSMFGRSLGGSWGGGK